MYGDRRTLDRLMDVARRDRLAYLLAQIEAGAQCCSSSTPGSAPSAPYDYEKYAAPYSRAVLDAVSGHGVPVIHFANGATGMLPLFARSRRRRRRRRLAHRPRSRLGRDRPRRRHPGQPRPRRAARAAPAIEERVGRHPAPRAGRPGHVFNLGHGVLPQTPPDNVRHLVDSVHRSRASGADMTVDLSRAAAIDVALLSFGGPETSPTSPVHGAHDGRDAAAGAAAAAEEKYAADRRRLAAAGDQRAPGRRPEAELVAAARRSACACGPAFCTPAHRRRVPGRARRARRPRAPALALLVAPHHRHLQEGPRRRRPRRRCR